MPIDVFCHVIPRGYRARLESMVRKGRIAPFSDFFQGELRVPGISDLDERFSIMDSLPGTKQVISLSGPFLETIAPPDAGLELAKVANDEIARLVADHPDRFAAGVAALPFNDVESALEEIDRAVLELGLKGIQMGTDVAGKPLDAPEIVPVFERMAAHGLPVFIHPSRNSFAPDYPGEAESRYNLFSIIGWPHSTSMAMMRLAYGGVLERLPTLKLITHHAGGTVPYLAKRIELSDRAELPRPIGDYLRLFYGDTAVQGNTANLMCAHAFFGADHLLFGTDFPFNRDTSMAVRAVDAMDIPGDEKQRILEGNARRLLKLTG
jgi:predicted TIM-barrel fold metal-dependent hydrolase